MMWWTITLFDSYSSSYFCFVCNKYPTIALLRFAEEKGYKAQFLMLWYSIETTEEVKDELEDAGYNVYEWD